MKRAAAAQDERPKKAKLSKLSKQLQLQSQQMDEIIELVASQSDVGGKAMDRKNESAEDAQDMAEESADAHTDSRKSHKAQLTVECRKMRTEIAKLTSIVHGQQKKICSMEAMLTRVLSLLESTGVSTGQRGQQKLASWVSALGASGNQSRRRTNSTVDNTATSKKSSQNESGQGVWQANNRCSTYDQDQDQDDGHFTMIIHRTLNDMSRRKNNVVVTGLMEEKDTGKSDSESFAEFCENFMPIKPALTGINSCRRIGRPTEGRPRRLLVHLQSKEAADALLEAAPRLRYCDDSYVASSIFINQDLSPAEAKLAYEARKKRRDRQQRHSANFIASDENSEDPEENCTSKNVTSIRHAVSPGKNVEAASFSWTSSVPANPAESSTVVPGALTSTGQIAAPGDAPVPASTSSTFQ